LRPLAPRAHLAHPLRGAAGVRAHDVDAVHDPDRRADLRRVRQHHDDAGGSQGLGHAFQRAPHRGGGGHLRRLRRARHGHGRAVDDPAHHPGVLPRHRAPGLRPGVVRHHHRVRGRDRPHQPARRHEHVRAAHADPPGEHGHHLQRRAALHVGRHRAPGHPRGVPLAVALAAESHAMIGATRRAAPAPAAPPFAWLSDGLVALLVAELVVVVFFPALRAGFVAWDDDTYFLGNPYYRGLGGAQLAWMFTAMSGHYMPLTWLTHGLDYVLWGMRPTGYHAVNLLLHALAAAAAYFVALRVLAAAVAPEPRGARRFAAAVAALLFAVHPLRV